MALWLGDVYDWTRIIAESSRRESERNLPMDAGPPRQHYLAQGQLAGFLAGACARLWK